MGLFSKKKKGAEAAAINEAEACDEQAAGLETANDELIAVLSAAVAAYEAEQFVQTLYIQKLNRACRVLPAWGAMGTQEAIDSRRM